MPCLNSGRSDCFRGLTKSYKMNALAYHNAENVCPFQPTVLIMFYISFDTPHTHTTFSFRRMRLVSESLHIKKTVIAKKEMVPYDLAEHVVHWNRPRCFLPHAFVIQYTGTHPALYAVGTVSFFSGNKGPVREGSYSVYVVLRLQICEGIISAVSCITIKCCLNTALP
jgi:hypothetical protein